VAVTTVVVGAEGVVVVVCAPAAAEMVIAKMPAKLICNIEDERGYIPSHQLSPPI
jgi:hypothetical protein